MNLPELICAAVISIGMPNANLACEKMELLVEQASKHNIEPEVMVALIQTESNWTPRVVSHANACGLTQVIPKWTGGVASKKIKYTCEQLKDPDTSIVAGTTIFNYWLHKYGRCKQGTKCRRKSYLIGLCGYNAGFRCKGENPHPKGMGYAKTVLWRAKKIKRRMAKIEKENQKQ